MESRASTRRRRQKERKNIKLEGADKLPDAHPASGSLAPGPSSTLADKTEEQEVIPLNGISVKELASRLHGHGTQQEPTAKKKKKRALSSSSSIDSELETQSGSSSDTSEAESV